MTFEEAVTYLRSTNRAFCKPGLSRVLAICDAIGARDGLPPVIHVAGTNGKGSFCAMLSAILRAAGYRTGVFSSPGIKHFTDMITVDGIPISDDALAARVEAIRPFADRMEDRPTEFEITVAIALSYLRDADCDIIVMEAGMGGRGDATNILSSPLLSVITGVALDHTDFLGHTIAAIAEEKAGIIKKGRPVLFGGKSDEALAVIDRVAREQAAPLYTVDGDAATQAEYTLDGTRFTLPVYGELYLPLLGLYQVQNALTVLRAIDILRAEGLSISCEAVRTGLAAARHPARFEVLSREPLVIFDGAHNAEGIDAAVAAVRHYFHGERVYVMTGVLRDKDHAHIAARIAEIASRAFVMAPENPRALPADEYARELFALGIAATPYPSAEAAFAAAREAAEQDGVPLICLGSLYTYASIAR